MHISYISPYDSSNGNIPHGLGVAGVILDIGSANERRIYVVMSALTSWAYTKNAPCVLTTAGTQYTFNTGVMINATLFLASH